MLLSQLVYFEALARHRHFGRAAASCFVTTSTLSEAIRKLERELGAPLVERGKTSFRGLTPDGEIVLTYARRILAEQRHLEEDLVASRRELTATLRLGVIPSGIGWAAGLLGRLTDAHPGVTVDMQTSLRSEQIVEKIRTHDLDAGVIHPRSGTAGSTDGPVNGPASNAGLHLTELGSTRFVLTGADPLLGRFTDAGVSGTDLATLPLALLSPGMRAREAFDRAMEDAGVRITPTAEADSAEALLALAATGRWAAVVPETAPGVGAASPGLVVVPLRDPEVHMGVALVRLDTTPVPALSAAVDAAASGGARP